MHRPTQARRSRRGSRNAPRPHAAHSWASAPRRDPRRCPARRLRRPARPRDRYALRGRLVSRSDPARSRRRLRSDRANRRDGLRSVVIGRDHRRGLARGLAGRRRRAARFTRAARPQRVRRARGSGRSRSERARVRRGDRALARRLPGQSARRIGVHRLPAAGGRRTPRRAPRDDAPVNDERARPLRRDPV